MQMNLHNMPVFLSSPTQPMCCFLHTMASSPFRLLVLCCVLRQCCGQSSSEWFNNVSTSLFNLSGDIMLGGLFSINQLTSNLSERTEPDNVTCARYGILIFNFGILLCIKSSVLFHSLNEFGLGLAIVMKYAIDEVNANPMLLPGIKLGYKIYDTCRQSAVIIRPTISFLTEKSTKALSVQCNYTDYETSMSAVIGPNSSEMVAIIGKLLGFFLMPQVG